MLEITVPCAEIFDDETQEFITVCEETTLQLEHSLVSLSKWEAKWHKAFLSKNDKTFEETIDYVRCMTLNENVRPEVYDNLSSENIDQINRYIEEPMTATVITEEPGNNKKTNNEVTTAELIYYWMIAHNIPFECKHWHLNSLITLIRVCNVKNAPPKKRSKKDIMSRNTALNAARRKRMGTRG